VSKRYTKFLALGAGSYGLVAKCHDLVTGDDVAIKKLMGVFELGSTEGLHVIRELRLMRVLQHENILSLITIDPPSNYATFEDIYLVMPLMDGDLSKLLRAPTGLSTTRARKILYQILLALHYMHSAGVVHRDLKPENVMLSQRPAPDHVRICDLGLARKMKDNDPTQTKDVVTRIYRAPEVMLGEPYTSAIDIWSYGCLVGEVFGKGRPVFRQKSMKSSQVEAIFQVIGTPSEEELTRLVSGKANLWFIKRMSKYPKVAFSEDRRFKDVDPHALDLLTRCLQFDPAKRPSALELLEHPFFEPCREVDREVEVPKDFPHELEPDHDGKIPVKVLRRLAWEEIIQFNPEAKSQLPSAEEFNDTSQGGMSLLSRLLGM